MTCGEPPSRRLRVGVIGGGLMGRHHAGVLAGLPDVDLAGVADPDPGRGDVPDWRLLLDRRLDAVVVATPPDLHEEPATAALAAGVAVYLEKPLAHEPAAGQRLAAAARAAAASGVVSAVGYQYRVISVLDRLPRRPRMLVGRGLSAATPRPWLGDAGRGGSHLLERASHLVDLVGAVAGPVRLAHAVEHGETCALTLLTADDGVATVSLAAVPGGPGWSLGVAGQEGYAHLELDGTPVLTGPSGTHVHRGPDLVTASVARFVGAVRAGEPGAVGCTLDDALATLRVVAQAQQVARGQPAGAVGP